jgi:UDP-GlcNAc:undecaprenyl-phosphate GlcNAc-1-phosphate transferase
VRRVNHRGRRVLFPLGILLLAPALAALAVAPSRWLVYVCGVGALGLVDDGWGGGGPRGWRGHGRALARGALSTGVLKAAGTVALAAWAAAGDDAHGSRLIAEVAVLVLSAHLGNLLDTRPGRAEKSLGLAAAAVCVAARSLAPLEPVAPVLPAAAACSWLTLRERGMLGDTGASLIGATTGVLAVTALPAAALPPVLAALIAISLYGEFRSLGRAIERVPLLARLDSLGRVS